MDYSKYHKYDPFGYGCVCDPQEPKLKTDPIPYGRSFLLLAVGSFNNDLPFVNGGKFANMESAQPQKGFYHEAVYRIRLYNLYCLFGGVLEDL